MKWNRISALLIRYLYLHKRSLPRIMDIIYWPVLNVLLWGFFSAYLDKIKLGGFNALTVLPGAIILWDLLSQSQRAISLSFLEDVWERNLLNLFVTPLRVTEFLIAAVLVGMIRIIMVVVVMGVLAAVFYSVSTLPEKIRFISYLLPSTHIFEGMREVVSSGTFPTSDLLWAFVANFIYLILVCWFFYRMFARVKEKGALIKLED